MSSSMRPITKGDQNYNKEFLAIVDAFGGKNCTSWTQVARKYEQTTGQKVLKANTLRYRWEQLTGYSENFTPEQSTLLITTDIKAKGVKQQGLMDFYKQTGIKLYKGRFCRITSQHLKQAIQMLDEVFAKERKHRRLGRKDSDNKLKLSHLSIYILLRAKDILNSNNFKQSNILTQFDEFIFNQILEMSQLCEQLFLLHAKIYRQDRVERFEQYQKIVTRYTYRKLMFYVEYLDILRKISVQQCTDDTFVSHPLILRNIAKNKETLVYRNLIQENDWGQKYEWFNECTKTQVEEEDFSLLLKQQTGKRKQNLSQQNFDMHSESLSQSQIELNKLQFDFVPKFTHKIYNQTGQSKATPKVEKEYRKFRGHFIKPGDTRTDTRYTKIFTCDTDSEYNSNQDEEEARIEANERNKELQQLYIKAFVEVPNRKKQQKNQIENYLM